MAPRLRLVRPPVGRVRTEAVALIERHGNLAVGWLLTLIEAYTDPTATDTELTNLRETALTAIEARIATLRADLRSAAR